MYPSSSSHSGYCRAYSSFLKDRESSQWYTSKNFLNSIDDSFVRIRLCPAPNGPLLVVIGNFQRGKDVEMSLAKIGDDVPRVF